MPLSFSYRIFIFLLNMSYFFCCEYLFNLCYYFIAFMGKSPVKDKMSMNAFFRSRIQEFQK